ncbi:MAG: rRNA maturation RNase YbeY [Candidatus Zixiibacteriota bacterium]|nr:MAG: rRNA maturation RNase YbeY [candidate division Zixibacteria bacterium]
MHLNIISQTDRRIPRKKIGELITLIEEEEEPPDSTLNIIFVGDSWIRRLNREFRGIAGTTDVLSFNIDEEPGEDCIIGEIYVSTDTAAKNARSEQVSFTEELLRLCCHGLLHLLGYDHIKAKDSKVMQTREDYYLGRMK